MYMFRWMQISFFTVLLSVLLSTSLLLAGCGSSPARTLNVYAASSLTDAFTALAAAFEAEAASEVEIRLNFGGSSALAAQIIAGAPADVFASANPVQMTRVTDAGLLADDARIFATNRLTVIVPTANPGAVESLMDLAAPGLRLVVAAPGVPVRDYLQTVLGRMAADAAYGPVYVDSVLANVVSEEDNVRQVVLKVALNEADAGVAYLSDVTPDIAAQVMTLAIPDEYNITARYPVAVLAEAASEATAFVDFLLSPAGQSILRDYGFGPSG